jgi:hypothetical protein
MHRLGNTPQTMIKQFLSSSTAFRHRAGQIRVVVPPCSHFDALHELHTGNRSVQVTVMQRANVNHRLQNAHRLVLNQQRQKIILPTKTSEPF